MVVTAIPAASSDRVSGSSQYPETVESVTTKAFLPRIRGLISFPAPAISPGPTRIS